MAHPPGTIEIMLRGALLTLVVALAAVSPAQQLTPVFFFFDDPFSTDVNPSAVSEPVFVGADCRDVAYDPSLDVLIVSEDDGDALHVCDPETGAVLRTIADAASGGGSVNPYGVAVSEDGVIFVSSINRTINWFADATTSSPASGLLMDRDTVNPVGLTRAIHVTGSVAAGTARLFADAGGTIVVIDVSGTPPSLEATRRTDWISGIPNANGMGGDVGRIYLVDDFSGVAVADLVDGGDGIIPSDDDTYAVTSDGADDQIGEGLIRLGMAASRDPGIDLGPGVTQSGVFAVLEKSGQDGIGMASLGSSAGSGELIALADPSTAEDLDQDGFWDGGADNFLNGTGFDGGVEVAVRGGEVWIWVTIPDFDGGFGGFTVPGSTPVELSIISAD